jgi:hypothetical protein
MTKYEQQRAREDKFLKLVQSLLPEGWSACVGCFMDMMSATLSKNHISVSCNERMPEDIRYTHKAKTEEEQLWIRAERKAWHASRKAQAEDIAVVLRRELPSKARVCQEGGTVYVMGLI